MRVDEPYKQAMNTPSALQSQGVKTVGGLFLWPFLHLKSFFLLFGFVLFCVVLVMFTRLGVMTVPVLSSWFYKEPQPQDWVRVVTLDSVSKQLSQQVIGIQQGGTKEWKINNEQVTALLRAGLKESHVPVDFIQVDMQMNRLEVYAKMWNRVVFQAKAVPYLSGDVLKWGLTYCSVGNQRIPCGFIPSILTDQMSRVVSDFLPKAWKMQEVRVEDNQLILTVSL